MIRSACSDRNHPLLKPLSKNSSLILYPEHPRVTVDWHVSLPFIFIQIQSISSRPMLLCCGNTRWERPRHRANGNKHTHAWGISHTCQQSIMAGPHTVPTAFTPFDTWTNIQDSGHQTLLILSQGSQQRRVEWWIKARIRGEQKADEHKQALQDGVSL